MPADLKTVRSGRRRTVTEPPATVSVVLPTYNRLERLQRVLASLANQDVDEPFEVVVVSDGSTDGTDDYLRGGGTPLDVIAVFQDNAGPAAARNAGVARATGDLIVFIDDDVVADPALVRTHVEAHRRFGTRVAVIGPMLDPPDHQLSSWIDWEQHMLRKQYQALADGVYTATALQFYTGNASIRKEHLDAVGGFALQLRRAEDVELAFRLHNIGIEFEYEPRAVGLHYAERSYESWLAAATAYGRNDVQFANDPDNPFTSQVQWNYRSRHIVIRILIQVAILSSGAGRGLSRVFGALVVPHPSPRRARLVRYALSVQYAIAYYRGLADEIDSVVATERLLLLGSRPS